MKKLTLAIILFSLISCGTESSSSSDNSGLVKYTGKFYLTDILVYINATDDILGGSFTTFYADSVNCITEISNEGSRYKYTETNDCNALGIADNSWPINNTDTFENLTMLEKVGDTVPLLPNSNITPVEGRDRGIISSGVGGLEGDTKISVEIYEDGLKKMFNRDVGDIKIIYSYNYSKIW